MNTNLKYLGLGAAALTGLLALAPQASAQTVAVADFDAAVIKTKAFTVANDAIKAQYKTQIASADATRKEMQPLLAPFDLNKDGQIDENEQAAAQSNPGWATIVQKQTAMNNAMAPVGRAQAYAFSQVSAKLDTAAQTVISARGITIILKPAAIVWANQVGDVTPAITAELDKLVPSVSPTPPANWQPGQPAAGTTGPAPAPSAVPGATPPAPTTGKKPAGR